jgi:molybdopterin-guanine dinucleotide biosynthesis protein A
VATVGSVFDAIVLAGGAARRLGGVDKPAQQVGGTSLLARVVAAAAGARRIVVVGPRREVGELPRQVTWRRESPPGTGPVAALTAGLGATSAPTLLVLAADLPYVAPAVAPLLAAVTGGADVALLVDDTGRVNHLAGAWRRKALRAALDSLGGGAGAAMRSLVDAAGEPTLVPDDGGWGRDCDTWDDLERARARLER